MEVILLIGLAVGVDYSLFYIRREREERAAGRSERAALEAAAATSGRAVLISGITVIIAMAGMLLSGDKTFMSFAIGTMIVVAVAMIGSLTVLPAVLSRLGDQVEKGQIPFLHRRRKRPRAASGARSSTASCATRCVGPRGRRAAPGARTAGPAPAHGSDRHRGIHEPAGRALPRLARRSRARRTRPSSRSRPTTSDAQVKAVADLKGRRSRPAR